MVAPQLEQVVVDSVETEALPEAPAGAPVPEAEAVSEEATFSEDCPFCPCCSVSCSVWTRSEDWPRPLPTAPICMLMPISSLTRNGKKGGPTVPTSPFRFGLPAGREQSRDNSFP